MLPGDPSPLQEWLVAIPSILTAISTWYISWRNKKSKNETHEKISELRLSNSDEMKNLVKKLDDRVTVVEAKIDTEISEVKTLISEFSAERKSQSKQPIGSSQAFAPAMD